MRLQKFSAKKRKFEKNSEIDEFCMYMDIKTVSLDHLDEPYLNIGIWDNSEGKIKFNK